MIFLQPAGAIHDQEAKDRWIKKIKKVNDDKEGKKIGVKKWKLAKNE